MTDDIVAFIRARLDERANADWHARTCQTHQTMPPGTPFGLAGSPMSCNCGVPDQVDRGVEAKRRILDKLSAWEHDYTGPYPCSPDGAICECSVHDRRLDVLSGLAAEWSTHEDYRSEWTP